MPTVPEEVKNETPKQELPELTLANLLGDLKDGIYYFLFDPAFNVFVIPVMVVVESIACKVIAHHIPYTDIDYTAYMEQVDIIRFGELNYDNIYGRTGPLVYPAGHVWIYWFLNILTTGTENIAMGQWFFGWLYVSTFATVSAIYYILGCPPWVIYLLSISKRLHSIYVLRMFNDCFTTYFAALTVLTLVLSQKTKNTKKTVSQVLTNVVAPFIYSIAISVKMNALLYMPGFLLVTYFLNDEVLLSLLAPFTVMILTQVAIAYPFLFNGDEIRNAYFSGAFDFSRVFMYKWTVNWKFLSEDTFLDAQFHKLLLVAQVSVLILFLFTKWATPAVTGKSTMQLIKDGFNIIKPTLLPKHIINDQDQGARYVVGVLTASNFIGVICARSLHYQFLSWYAWTLPFLLWSSGLPMALAVPVALAHEWCWNVYPSTAVSSAVLIVVNCGVLVNYWVSSDVKKVDVTAEKKEQ